VRGGGWILGKGRRGRQKAMMGQLGLIGAETAEARFAPYDFRKLQQPSHTVQQSAHSPVPFNQLRNPLSHCHSILTPVCPDDIFSSVHAQRKDPQPRPLDPAPSANKAPPPSHSPIRTSEAQPKCGDDPVEEPRNRLFPNTHEGAR
jgi:hypothetical protein